MARLVTILRTSLLTAAVVLTGCKTSAELVEMRATLVEIADQQERLEAAQAQLLAQQVTAEKERADLRTQQADLSARQGAVSGRIDAIDENLRNRRPSAGYAQPDPAVVYQVSVGDAPVRGRADAKVTIVEWSDFQCPFCQRVQPTLEQLLREYEGDVRIVYKHSPLPFHTRARPAAIAAEAARRQGKFWEMHDKLFANRKELTDEHFLAWAKSLRLDMRKFKRDLADPEVVSRIESQMAQGRTLGARGTPAFFINGRFLSGAQPIDRFRALVDETMKVAERALADGTPPSELYDALVGQGREAP